MENDIRMLWKKIFPRESSLDFGTTMGVIVLKLVSIRPHSIIQGLLIRRTDRRSTFAMEEEIWQAWT